MATLPTAQSQAGRSSISVADNTKFNVGDALVGAVPALAKLYAGMQATDARADAAKAKAQAGLDAKTNESVAQTTANNLVSDFLSGTAETVTQFEDLNSRQLKIATLVKDGTLTADQAKSISTYEKQRAKFDAQRAQFPLQADKRALQWKAFKESFSAQNPKAARVAELLSKEHNPMFAAGSDMKERVASAQKELQSIRKYSGVREPTEKDRESYLLNKKWLADAETDTAVGKSDFYGMANIMHRQVSVNIGEISNNAAQLLDAEGHIDVKSERGAALFEKLRLDKQAAIQAINSAIVDAAKNGHNLPPSLATASVQRVVSSYARLEKQLLDGTTAEQLKLYTTIKDGLIKNGAGQDLDMSLKILDASGEAGSAMLAGILNGDVNIIESITLVAGHAGQDLSSIADVARTAVQAMNTISKTKVEGWGKLEKLFSRKQMADKAPVPDDLVVKDLELLDHMTKNAESVGDYLDIISTDNYKEKLVTGSSEVQAKAKFVFQNKSTQVVRSIRDGNYVVQMDPTDPQRVVVSHMSAPSGRTGPSPAGTGGRREFVNTTLTETLNKLIRTQDDVGFRGMLGKSRELFGTVIKRFTPKIDADGNKITIPTMNDI